MIEILNGMHETINYGDSQGFRLYHNVEYEDYGDHWHTGIEIIMPVENGYTVIVGEERLELKEGDIVLINSGIIHSLEAPPTGERIILQFDTALLYGLKGMETLLFMMQPLIFLPNRKEDELYGFIYEKLRKVIHEYDSNSAFKEALIYASLIEIFVELGRREVYQIETEEKIPSAKKQVYIEAVMGACAYINSHYQENLTLEEVAAVSGFSKYHFTRIFKQYMNMTFYEYLNSKRVKRAEELLYNQEMSVTDVAMNSGFSSLSAFNRTFKTLKNCAPSDFRKKWECLQCKKTEP
ncbi:AraC family transcriptional regulator [Murimonas intestini]|uniref:AraC-like DNA-binding protein n=1 Tax=Murimonas intestini TaxID=1337051 RepID=A0AB73T2K6_9FIRM|nr:AraC family transcriptional regulator [Murimonas intestini]MCR1842680.1 AraC family transcriptional regulator [Murimonas intestini]MCR1867273.1 AraC family transcriptional regulator [Murimonas intestini]MCR1884459.1 AraC family transcriptional regulator [Murimonas intestini]